MNIYSLLQLSGSTVTSHLHGFGFCLWLCGWYLHAFLGIYMFLSMYKNVAKLETTFSIVSGSLSVLLRCFSQGQRKLAVHPSKDGTKQGAPWMKRQQIQPKLLGNIFACKKCNQKLFAKLPLREYMVIADSSGGI